MVRLIALVLLLLAWLPAQAQQDEFGLNLRDARLLREGLQATRDARSFQFTLTATLDVTSGTERVQITLDGSGTVLAGAAPALDVTVNARTDGLPDVPARFTADLRLVEGMVYVRGTDLTTGASDGWQAQPVGAINDLLASSTGSADMEALAGLAQPLQAINWVEFIRMTRPGQLPRFVAEFQFRDFFLSPGFATFLGELLVASDPDTTYTPQQVSAIAAVMTTLFRDPRLTAEFIFGLNDQRLRSGTFELYLNFDPSAFDAGSAPVTVNLNAEVRLDGYDQPHTIAAPEGVGVPVVIAPTAAPPEVQPIPGKALFPDQPVRIQMTGDGPLDLVFYATAPTTISVYTRSLVDSDAAVDTTLEVFGVDGASLAANDDLNTTSGDAGIENLALPAPGAYRIQLGTFGRGETGGVEVRLVQAGTPTPQPPSLAETVEGRIEGSRPFEYSFTGRAGQLVTITAQAVNPPSPNLDLAVAIYNPDGTQLDYDDDSGVEAGLGSRDAALLGVELPSDGDYRIEVSSYMGIKGDFRLVVAPER